MKGEMTEDFLSWKDREPSHIQAGDRCGMLNVLSVSTPPHHRMIYMVLLLLLPPGLHVQNAPTIPHPKPCTPLGQNRSEQAWCFSQPNLPTQLHLLTSSNPVQIDIACHVVVVVVVE